jgi:hypothetical protein
MNWVPVVLGMLFLLALLWAVWHSLNNFGQ